MIIVPEEPEIVNVKVSFAATPKLTIQTMPAPTVKVSQTLPPNVAIAVPGPQGPPGLQNVFVGPNPPADPVVNTIWIQTV